MKDQDQFSKVLLWHITKLQAELADARAEIDMLLAVHRPDEPSKQFLQESRMRSDAIWREMYVEACQMSGLTTEPPTAPDDTLGDDSRN